MKKSIRNILLTTLGVMIVTRFTSRTKKINFLTSPIVPGAKGYVKVKRDNNKNYSVKVEVSDLAQVERVNAAKSTYVVWMETDKDKVLNLGQLKSLTSFMSERHNASLETVSPYKPVEIFITTEKTANLKYPGEEIVLTTGKF